MHNLVLVTGCARSGTSMVAGIVNLCGAFGGKMARANGSNRKGMFENTAIRNSIVKPFLASIGADRMGQKPLPDRSICKIVAETKGEEWRKMVMSVFYEQGYTDGAFFYKGAKMCLMWPVWASAFPNARWIIVRRDDGGIIDSCLFTNFMRAYRNREGWQCWLDEHKKCFTEMEDAGLKVKQIWSGEIIHGNFTEIRNAVEWAGLTWNDSAVRKFVDPTLFHMKQGVEHA